jgi:hypothetical protein
MLLSLPAPAPLDEAPQPTGSSASEASDVRRWNRVID